jgi:hypothetical protein
MILDARELAATFDLEKLTPWLDWAFAEEKRVASSE